MSARILIVHDQQLRRDQMREALGPMHKVTVVCGIGEAILVLEELEKRLNESPVDMIISAVHLDTHDNMSVFDFLKWAKGNPQVRPVPFILVCNQPSRLAKYVVDAVRQAGQALGAAGYMTFDTFDAKAFLMDIESYLPAELRSVSPEELEIKPPPSENPS